jgi:hypothetical protein
MTTLSHSTLGTWRRVSVNLEVDVIAGHVERIVRGLR